MLVAPEIADLLDDSGAKLALVDDEFRSPLLRAAEESGVPAQVLRDGSGEDLFARATGVGAGTDVEARGPLDPAVVFYTSGTTGRPKGAVLTHGNLVMNCFVSAFITNEFERDDVVLGCLPLFHIFGQVVAMNSTFLRGGTLVLERRFSPAEALALIDEHGVTVLIGVPTIYIALLEAAGDDVPESLRLCLSGGAPLPVAVSEAFEERFDTRILEGYGLSETSPVATSNQLLTGLRPGTVGHPIWGVEVEVAKADLEGRIELLPTEEKGEIVIRGHNIFAGYLDRPQETADVVVDGWFRTGDIGIKDADGFVRIVGRKKDMILRAGFNVYPREVEEVLVRHPAVGEVAVVGIPHPTHGEEVLAVVVRNGSGPQATGSELVEWSRERIARHRRPRLVEFVDELPQGPSRKVLKRELRDRFVDLASQAEP
jgi:long-chain acyl-CoA synthetase